MKEFISKNENLDDILLSKSITEQAYCIYHEINLKKCESCNKEYQFISFQEGYKEKCSCSKEINLYEEMIDMTMQDRYSYVKKNNLSSLLKTNGKTISEKIYLMFNEKQFCICGKETKYKNISEGYFKYCSSKCSSNSIETKNKKEITLMDSYNVNNAFKLANNEKRIENLMKSEKNVFRATNYGWKTSLTLKSFSLEKKEEIKIKTRNTLIEKYGENYKEIIYPKFRKSILKKNFERKKYILNNLGIEPLFSDEEYNGCEDRYKFKCKKCDNVFFGNLNNGLYPTCSFCNKLNGTSKKEIELGLFLQNFDFENKNRKIINPLEIDFLNKEKKIGIEFNGIYFHSIEFMEKKKISNPKEYHLKKFNLMKEKGFSLLSINEDEWNSKTKQEIWKSIILNKLGKIENKMNARDGVIKHISQLEADIFLDENHLQGSLNASYRYGLFIKERLVSVMTLGKPKEDKNYEYDLYRFASLKNTIVRGAGSKLFKFFVNEKKPRTVLSYANKRYSSNPLYSEIGFKLVGETKPGFKYVKNGKTYSRQLFQKK